MKISLTEYLEDPCGKLSIPYWKAQALTLPGNVKVVHDREYSEDLLDAYTDERYFRLSNTMERIDRTPLIGFSIATAGAEDVGEFVSIINRSYADLKVSERQIRGYRETAVFRPDLWVLAREKSSGNSVAAGIADYDPRAKELVLEWIQVLPGFRKRGIGKAVVNELLSRMAGIARFATVSGKLDSRSNPEALYRRCGFGGNDIWHVLRAK